MKSSTMRPGKKAVWQLESDALVRLTDKVEDTFDGKVGAARQWLRTPPFDPFKAGRAAVAALKKAEAGHVDRTAAAKFLGIGLAELHMRLKRRKIVTWVNAAGHYRFPKWQFGRKGLLPGVAECLRVLDSDDYWAVMRYFLSPAESAGDVSPLQLLRAGRVQEAVQIAKQARGSPGQCARKRPDPRGHSRRNSRH